MPTTKSRPSTRPAPRTHAQLRRIYDATVIELKMLAKERDEIKAKLAKAEKELQEIAADDDKRAAAEQTRVDREYETAKLRNADLAILREQLLTAWQQVIEARFADADTDRNAALNKARAALEAMAAVKLLHPPQTPSWMNLAVIGALGMPLLLWGLLGKRRDATSPAGPT